MADTKDEVPAKLVLYVGNDGSLQSSVASAMALFIAANGDYMNTIIYGANLGGDTDTIACIAGMIAGAYNGYSVIDKEWIEIFDSAYKELDFKTLAHDLMGVIK